MKAFMYKLRTTLGKLGEFWAHIAIFWLARVALKFCALVVNKGFENTWNLLKT